MKRSPVSSVQSWDITSERAMAYISELSGTLYMLRWIGAVTAADLARQLHELATARRQVVRPLVYVSVTPEDVEPPSGAAREALDRFAGQAEPYCSAVHLVLEGRGFRGTIIRSIVTGVVLARRQHGLVSVHATFEAALQDIQDQGVGIGEAPRAASAIGMARRDLRRTLIRAAGR